MTKGRLKILAILTACLTPASAYYHYVHYSNPTSPYAPIREKFDLRTLPESTVTFFVSTAGPISYSPNDSFPSVLSEIRDATQVWNSVNTSGLRVAFGGLQITGTPQNMAGGEVVFEEMPPGLLAFAGPSSKADVTPDANGNPFVPILWSIVHLNYDLTQKPGPSYMQSFFTTVVHEMGHAIGLQHTWTSATMSTAVTRATSRARPLDADDIAGISLLYPRGEFPSAFGSISGTVISAGQGVHLASVVALLPSGSAISALTNPDGTYEIDGVPPGAYWVYVHPLPPSANIWYPRDSTGAAMPPSGPFVSQFYNATTNPAQFATVMVSKGNTAAGINFSVQPRPSVEAFDVSSYSFFGQAAVQPAFLNAATPVQTVVANGNNITPGNNTTTVSTVQTLGSAPLTAYKIQPYGYPDTSLALYFNYLSPPPSGPEHLLFTMQDGDIYVLPQAIQIVQNQPPAVTALASNSDGSVTVTGTGMESDSQVFFDGLPSQTTVPFASGSITVMPPPGASGQVSTLTIFNGDGQNSMFLQSDAPYTYTYPQTVAPAAAISTAALPQGASAMVDITTSTMQFVDGLTSLGFGSGDVSVERLWVRSPTHVIANVTVSPTALQRSTIASVISGFEVYRQEMGFQVNPASPNLPIIGLPLANGNPLLNSLYAGGVAVIYGSNLMVSGATPTVRVSGESAPILFSSPGQINFTIPADIPTGPAIMKFSNGVTAAFPVALQIDPPPPVIAAAPAAATAGDTITLTVTGLDPTVLTAPSRVTVTEGTLNISGFTLQAATDGSSNIQIQFTLDPTVTGAEVPVTLSVDGDLSAPVYINVAAGA